MRQFILPESWDGGATCLIEGNLAHYVARVLRLEKGDSFPGRDSGGRLWTCSVLESGIGRILLSVEALPVPCEDLGAERRLGGLPRILLVQGLPKGAKMDLVVRQATEAGISDVVPLLSARALTKGEVDYRPRLARWRRIIKEALQQSGSGIITEIASPIGLSELSGALASRGVAASDPKILFHESPLAQASLHGYLSGAPEAIVLCIGPEGGFAPEEVDFLLSGGFKPLKFAGAILRAETAALYAIAAVQIILSERSSWIPKFP